MSKAVSNFKQQIIQEKIPAGRKKVLLASLRLFADNGFHKTTIDGIATEAKVSVGTIYKYFDSKNAILTELLTPLLNGIKNDVLSNLSEFDNLNELIDFLITDRLTFAQSNIDLIKIMIQEILTNEDVKPIYHDLFFGSGGLTVAVKRIYKSFPEINRQWSPVQIIRIVTAPIAGLIIQQEIKGVPNVTRSDLLTVRRQIIAGLTSSNCE